MKFTINGQEKTIKVREWEIGGATVWASEKTGILLKAEGSYYTWKLTKTNADIPEESFISGIIDWLKDLF